MENCPRLQIFPARGVPAERSGSEPQRLAPGTSHSGPVSPRGPNTGVIDRLEKASFARRAKDTADRRRVIIEPLPERIEIAPLFESIAREMADLCAGYSTGELYFIRDFIIRFRQGVANATRELREPHLAVSLERQGRFEEAATEFQEAARLFPEKRAQWNGDMRRMLMRLGRSAEVRAARKEELTTHPTGPDDWFGYAELCLFLEDKDEYHRVRHDLLAQVGATNDPDVAERTGRACLLLPPAADELRQAVALTERAVAVGRAGHEFIYP